MPLHLLGKKSWNVYNPANIERVKRDEAEAQARAEAEEKRRQGLEAERRLAILRGEIPPALPASSPAPELAPDAPVGTHRKREHRDGDDPAATFRGGERRKRKRFGEDDTDFEMRVARERTDAVSTSTIARPNNTSQKTSDAPLVDARGHISLFPEGAGGGGAAAAAAVPENEKNEDAEREAAAKRREFEDQYTMRFFNATGRDTSATAGPWYVSGRSRDAAESRVEAPGKDAWGRDDPKRKARDAARVVAGDPLAMMKSGAAKVRDVERERRVLNEEKERELKQLRKEEKRRGKRRRRHHHGEIDELEGFSLEATAENVGAEKNGRHERDRRECRSGSRDGDGRDGQDKHRHGRRSDHDEHGERHHHHRDDRRHESKSHGSHPRDNREEGERQSSGQSRRRLTKTDHY